MLPNLEDLDLSANRIERLEQLAPLFKCSNLQRLNLQMNPVSLLPNYRETLAKNIPSLKWLDYEKITAKERDSGNQIIPIRAEIHLSKEEKLKKLIESATSMEQINKIELLLKSGKLSDDLLDRLLENPTLS